jgi:hypothetical protein
VTVNSFGPGLITRTGFFRNQQPLFVKVFDFFTNDVFHVAETVGRVAGILQCHGLGSSITRIFLGPLTTLAEWSPPGISSCALCSVEGG